MGSTEPPAVATLGGNSGVVATDGGEGNISGLKEDTKRAVGAQFVRYVRQAIGIVLDGADVA
jgi:hypothetical protein